jgi:hypothetical protein
MNQGARNNDVAEAGQAYNAHDALLALRATVEITNDREELRRIDAQLLQLSKTIKSKMGTRGRRRSR